MSAAGGWQALYALKHEVIFRRKHPISRQELSGFTNVSDLDVTIADEPLAHRRHHFPLELMPACTVECDHGTNAGGKVLANLSEVQIRMNKQRLRHHGRGMDCVALERADSLVYAGPFGRAFFRGTEYGLFVETRNAAGPLFLAD